MCVHGNLLKLFFLFLLSALESDGQDVVLLEEIGNDEPDDFWESQTLVDWAQAVLL